MHDELLQILHQFAYPLPHNNLSNEVTINQSLNGQQTMLRRTSTKSGSLKDKNHYFFQLYCIITGDTCPHDYEFIRNSLSLGPKLWVIISVGINSNGI